MKLTGFDHIVLCVRDLQATIGFYRDLLGMEPREERPGKWSLHFGANKVSLQDAVANPAIASDTIPGTENFCVLTDEPVPHVANTLRQRGVEITAEGERDGATGRILSIYFRDPDGNRIEAVTFV